MRTANPALGPKTFEAIVPGVGAGAMTIQGTVNKTGIMLVLLLISAGYTWNLFFAAAQIVTSSTAVSSIAGPGGGVMMPGGPPFGSFLPALLGGLGFVCLLVGLGYVVSEPSRWWLLTRRLAYVALTGRVLCTALEHHTSGRGKLLLFGVDIVFSVAAPALTLVVIGEV